MRIACWFGKHHWVEQPYPSRLGEKAWRLESMPYLIDDPLLWGLVYEECARCDAFNWHFGTKADAARYFIGLHILERRREWPWREWP